MSFATSNVWKPQPPPPHESPFHAPINTRNGFSGGLFGDYTDIAYGLDGVWHAFWTGSNNKAERGGVLGLHFTLRPPINQEDVVA